MLIQLHIPAFAAFPMLLSFDECSIPPAFFLDLGFSAKFVEEIRFLSLAFGLRSVWQDK